MEDSNIAQFPWKLPLKKESRIAFITVWIAGLVAHGYQIANLLLNGDGLYNLHAPGASLVEARCFLDFAAGIRSNESLPWLCGLLALFWLSLAMVLFVDLLEIHSPLLVVLVSAFFAVSPTVTAAYAYSFMVDSSMLDFLLAIAAVYLAHRFPRWGPFAGALCICFGLGIYQAYLTVAFSTIVLLAILQVIREQPTLRQLFRTYWKDLVMLLGGAVLYEILLKLMLHFTQTSLIDYQGISKAGLMTPWQYVVAVQKTFSKLAAALDLAHGPFYSVNSFLIYLLLALLVIGTAMIVYQKKLYRHVPAMLLLVLMVAALFFIPFAINFISPAVQYHALMEMGLCYPFILCVIYLKYLTQDMRPGKLFAIAVSAAVSLLIWHNVINANTAYYIMQFSYEKSAYSASDILGQLRAADGFDPSAGKVAVIGYWDALSSTELTVDPVIVGVSNDSFCVDQAHYLIYWDSFFGISLSGASPEETEAIRQTAEYQSMPVYPSAGCVQEINGIYVVRLPESAD